MIILTKELADNAWVEQLNIEMFNAEAERALHYEGEQVEFLGNSYGRGDMPVAYRLMHHLTPWVNAVYGNFKPANSYSRIYYNGSVLNPHLDREGLDITMTLCTFSNINKPWPLYVEFEGSTYGFETPPGCAAIIRGTEHRHWRTAMECEPHQKVVQVFLHWTKI